MDSRDAAEPLGIVVLEEHDPAPADPVFRLTPAQAADMLGRLADMLARLEEIRSLAQLSAPSSDPATRDVNARLTATATGKIDAQAAEISVLHNELAAAKTSFEASRAGHAAD